MFAVFYKPWDRFCDPEQVQAIFLTRSLAEKTRRELAQKYFEVWIIEVKVGTFEYLPRS